MSILRLAIRTIREAFGLRRDAPSHLHHRKDSHVESKKARDTISTESTSGTHARPDMLETFTLGGKAIDESLCPCYIEFVGGPLDGHMQGLPIVLEELAVTLAVPVNPVRLAAFNGSSRPIVGESERPTSVAFYERDIKCLIPPRFLVVGATRVEDARSLSAKQN